MMTTTPEIRHIQATGGTQTEWLCVEPPPLDSTQDHILEMTLQFTNVVGTVSINMYEQALDGAMVDQKTLRAPATIIFQSASLSPHYLKIIADPPDSQAEYVIAYAIRTQLQTTYQPFSRSASAVRSHQTDRPLLSADALSPRSLLLLSISVGICVCLSIVLSWSLSRTTKRLQKVKTNHSTGMPSVDYHILGDLAILHGKEHLAWRCYSRAALEPTNTSVHCELGKFLFQEKQYARAIKEFQIVLNGEPIPPEIYHYLAFSHLALNQLKQAEYYYEKSLEHHAEEFAENASWNEKKEKRRPPRVLSSYS